MASAFRRSIKGDKVIWMVVAMLFLFSILAVFSSSSKPSGTAMFSPLLKQSILIILGLFIMYIFHNIPISLYRKLAILGIIITIVLLLYMLAFGVTINGAKRWVRLFGLTFQPADVAKVAIILYLAKIFEEGNLNTFEKVFKKIILPVGIICTLIIIADASTALLIGTACLCIMFVGGVKMKYILNTIGIAIGALVLIFALDKTVLPKTRITDALDRIEVFFNKEKAKESPRKVYQANQAKIAVASGGIVGKGPGNSTQRYFLPYPYSDYIYAIILEEYGLIGGMAILMAYLWLLYRAVVISKKCSRLFPVILVLGLSLVIVFQAIIHMGVSVGLFPVTGQTLPLVSHGGSSIVFMSIALGITLAVSRTADNQELSLEGLEQDIDEGNTLPQKLKA
jgi:cell division protein FtsW